MKAHILIVEDDGVLYLRFKRLLEKENYTVDEQASSVEEAISLINKRQPDLALLDIKLKGQLTGLDLGKMLYETYKIPFIYITDFGDNETFYKGLQTNHEYFIEKTKPNLDEKQIVRTIQTILHKQEKQENKIVKDGVLVYVDYIEKTKEFKKEDVRRIPLKFDDILYFTTREINKNYIQAKTNDEKKYFLNTSLKKILEETPYNFVKISDSYLVNITHPSFQGRINGVKLKYDDLIIEISDTYKQEVEKRITHFYKT